MTLSVTATPVSNLVFVSLQDLALAPENIRFKEPADDGIPRLADTIAAANVVIPLSIRPGAKGEKPFMVLDGRRRLFALQALLAAGRIEANHPVKCELFEDRAAQTGPQRLAKYGVARCPRADVSNF